MKPSDYLNAEQLEATGGPKAPPLIRLAGQTELEQRDIIQAQAARIAALEAEGKAYQFQRDVMRTAFEASQAAKEPLTKRIRALEAANEKLMACLLEWGAHFPDCYHLASSPHLLHPCDCGFAEVVERLEASMKAGD